jgi:solute:Na+ symporter, SSS family
VRRSRYATLAWGLVLGALGLAPWGHVLEAGLTVASITYGGLLGVFLLGLWNRRSNQIGALVGLFVGIGAMLAVRFWTELAFTWYVLAGTAITLVAGSLASLVSRSTPSGLYNR